MDSILNNFATFPDLILEILDFFSTDHLVAKKGSNPANPRSISEFLQHYNGKFSHNKETQALEPLVITKICDKLCDMYVMILISRGVVAPFTSTYAFSPSMDWGNTPRNLQRLAVKKYECAVFGFSYIYNLYRSMIVPIIHYADNDDISIGTGFYWNGGIATAKHCLENSKKIAIQHFPAEVLNKSEIFISENPKMDIAFINADVQTTIPRHKQLIASESNPEIMDEVITMGYPKIPGFTQFQTVEKATISALPQKRFASTTGEVAAIAREMWMKENLLLITAKIKGGNSGGPVINKYGELIGIVSEIPAFKGDYDDLGYGTAIPIKFLSEIMISKPTTLQKTLFVDYVE